jgi:hypothetical protein
MSNRSTNFTPFSMVYFLSPIGDLVNQVGDLVLHRVQMKKGKHKLTPPWEGPYLVAEVI